MHIQRRRVVLVGTGGLATALSNSLATLPGPPLDIRVVGRTAASAKRVCAVASARAAAVGADLRFVPTADALSVDRPRLWSTPPDLAVVLASSQSPWEAAEDPSAWTDLVRAGGFGVTLPFQADLAGRLSHVAAADGVPFLNACLPDLVNPVLAHLGVPALAGLGNGATIHAFARAATGRADLRILAHHYHLHAPGPDEQDAWVETDAGDALDATALLTDMRDLPRDRLNQVTGLVSAQVVRALLDETATLRTTLPGVHDRQGGLPVRLADRSLTPDLPVGWSEADVRAANGAWSLADGAAVEGSKITLAPRAVRALSRHLDDLPETLEISDLSAFAASVSRLRDALRKQPSGAAP